MPLLFAGVGFQYSFTAEQENSLCDDYYCYLSFFLLNMQRLVGLQGARGIILNARLLLLIAPLAYEESRLTRRLRFNFIHH